MQVHHREANEKKGKNNVLYLNVPRLRYINYHNHDIGLLVL